MNRLSGCVVLCALFALLPVWGSTPGERLTAEDIVLQISGLTAATFVAVDPAFDYSTCDAFPVPLDLRCGLLANDQFDAESLQYAVRYTHGSANPLLPRTEVWRTRADGGTELVAYLEPRMVAEGRFDDGRIERLSVNLVRGEILLLLTTACYPVGAPACAYGRANEIVRIGGLAFLGPDGNPCPPGGPCIRCTTDAQCGDGNACTTDACVDPGTENSTCTHTPDPGASCDDGNACTTGDLCNAAGACVGGPPPSCDDGDPCTTDTCFGNAECSHSPVVCSPLDACHLAGACDAQTGVCSNPPAPDGTTCDDGSACTGSDACQSGTCAGTPVVTCNDGNDCTDDACAPATGACVFTPKPPGALSIPSDLTGIPAATVTAPVLASEVAGKGVYSLEANITFDPLVLTAQSVAQGALLSGNGCSLVPNLGLPGRVMIAIFCTEPLDGTGSIADISFLVADVAYGTTSALVLQGATLNEGCPPVTVQPGLFTALGQEICDGLDNDGDTLIDEDLGQTTCGLGACSHTIDNCANGQPQTCDPMQGAQPETCDGVDDDCNGTVDDGGAALCGDGNPCTDDVCNGAAGCANPNNTAPCDDGSACTKVDACAGGVCVGADPVVCDDGNLCTDETCDPSTGDCAKTYNTLPCDDGNACTTGDRCSNGACVGVAQAVPAEVSNEVRLARSGGGGQAIVSWQLASGATASDVVRGRIGALPVGPGGAEEVCLGNDLTALELRDNTAPTAGVGFWYLVRGVNACGPGTWGYVYYRRVPVQERATTTCP